MKRALIALMLAALALPAFGERPAARKLSYRDYLDKAHGGWIGKIAGLALGVPKEFAEPWPPSKGDYFAEVPDHFSDLYSGDDLYFPLLAQVCVKKYGTGVTQEQILNEWKAQLFTGRVWGANAIALEHSFAGIPAPKTGFPGYNGGHDIDAQIGLDPMGWIAPGLVNTAAQLADRPAHIMGWGDGADGAVFVAAMLSESFFTPEIVPLIRKAQAVLPAGSDYRRMIDDVLRWRTEQTDWRVTRQLLAKKYSPKGEPGDISAVVNGGAVLIGLLYGDGDFGKTVSIAMRCRWDSDCNASTAGGILGTMVGYSEIDSRWTAIFHDSYENYCLRGLPRWMRISDIARESVDLGEKVIREAGGEVSGSGEDRVYTIPVQKAAMLERNEEYSAAFIQRNESEMREHYVRALKDATRTWDPQWQLTWASFENPPQVLETYFGRKKVFRAQPGFKSAVTLERTISLAPGRRHFLRVGVAHHPNIINEQTGTPEIGGWKLEVLVDGQRIGEYTVATQGGLVVWEDPEFDLTPYAGKTVKVTLAGRWNMKFTEFYMASQTCYWSDAEVVSMDQPEPWR